MHISFLILVLSTISVSFCGRSVVQTIDDWQSQSDTIIIVLDQQALPSTQELFTISATENIIGQERDLELRVVSGDDGAIISISSTQELSLATPTNAHGGFLLQYDGIDGSMELNPTGLNNHDLTAKGADALQILASTDHPVNALISVTSGATRTSSFTLAISPSDEIVVYEIPFIEFSGNADFTEVGSISIEVATDVNVDMVVTLLSTSGPDKVFFINPPCGDVYNFEAQCSENKKDISYQSSSTSESSTSTSEDFSVELSISVLIQQYFSFTWNDFIEETNEAEFRVTKLESTDIQHLKSSGSTVTISLLAAIVVFLL